jgi:quinol monooxygenase YgiN
MLNLLISLEIKPEWLAEFLAAIRHNAAQSVAKDPGCRRFDVYVDEESATRFVVHEVYDSQEALDAHRASPHFLAYKAVADQALMSRALRMLRPI